MKKRRLDELVVARGYSPSRTKAQALIMAGRVRHRTTIYDKPGKRVPEDLEIEIIEKARYVGRGGEKLDGLLECFPIDCTGKSILDVGASTGGFTDCLLQRGASAATCVDVGRGQLHEKLRGDARVTNLEKINARGLAEEHLPFEQYDIVTIDLSFISLRKVLASVWPRVGEAGFLIALIKPQFEATREEADRGRGIIRDPEIIERITSEIRSFACSSLPECRERTCVACELPGRDGNREVFLVLQRAGA